MEIVLIVFVIYKKFWLQYKSQGFLVGFSMKNLKRRVKYK